MITLDVRGLEPVRDALRGLAYEQIPYAMMTAINRTAYQVMMAQREEIKTVFDRPTPFVQRAMKYEKATKETLTATVYSQSEAARALMPSVVGGQREVKPYEILMRNAGVLPAGRYVVPGAACKLDRYGNADSDVIGAVLNSLGLLSAAMQAGRKLTKKRDKALAQSGSYFVGGYGAGRHLFPGIWQRVNGRPRPILLFVTRATYEERYRFYDVGIAKVNEIFVDEMKAAVQQAIETAR